MRIVRALLVLVILGAVARDAHAGPILHERIPPDPAEDARLGVAIDGDLPAALNTPSGIVTAPDPHRPPSAPSQGSVADPDIANAEPNAKFHPDRDTHRPEVVPYDDPFTPSTAPFKRLLAFNWVDATYALSVHDPRLVNIPAHGQVALDGTDDTFFADLIVDLSPDRPERIPSVGPGAKIIHAHAGVGATDVGVRFVHDEADNWFVIGDAQTRARLVMELAIPRGVFGGTFGNPQWSDLAKVPPLPPNVARAAAQVAAHIGVSRASPPRVAVTQLVAYFRGFVDSDDFPTAGDDIYLALALSKKGVCRHRAFAFLVTALALGIPTRMIANEAHAWVEVNDGTMWRRIDLGGAGRAMNASLAGGVKHEHPPDPFAWPSNATRGEELADRARNTVASPGSSGSSPSNGTTNGESTTSPPADARDNYSAANDDRPAAHVTLALSTPDPHRGGALRVKGDVTADGAACGHVLVELSLADGHGLDLPLGALATDDDGNYDGTVTVPTTVPLGDYDLRAQTSGDARCGRGGSP